MENENASSSGSASGSGSGSGSVNWARETAAARRRRHNGPNPFARLDPRNVPLDTHVLADSPEPKQHTHSDVGPQTPQTLDDSPEAEAPSTPLRAGARHAPDPPTSVASESSPTAAAPANSQPSSAPPASFGPAAAPSASAANLGQTPAAAGFGSGPLLSATSPSSPAPRTAGFGPPAAPSPSSFAATDPSSFGNAASPSNLGQTAAAAGFGHGPFLSSTSPSSPAQRTAGFGPAAGLGPAGAFGHGVASPFSAEMGMGSGAALPPLHAVPPWRSGLRPLLSTRPMRIESAAAFANPAERHRHDHNDRKITSPQTHRPDERKSAEETVPLAPPPPPPPASPALSHPPLPSALPAGLGSVVSADSIKLRWRELHGAWSGAMRQNRQKRERDEKSRAPPAPAQPTDGGSATGRRLPQPIEPPLFFNPASANSMFNLFFRGLGGAGAGEAIPESVTTTEVRSPSGLSRQVIMMSSASPQNGSQRQVARMIFNDQRLDSTTAAARSTAAANAPHPFASGFASSQWRDLFRVGRQVGGPMTFPPQPGAVSTDTTLQSLLNRSLYEHQPSAASLRNGGTTLIVLQTPPATSDAENCPICLDNDRNQTWAQFPCCKNFAHEECAKKWLKERMTCPVCRTLIP